jgi:hypothetical protein
MFKSTLLSDLASLLGSNEARRKRTIAGSTFAGMLSLLLLVPGSSMLAQQSYERDPVPADLKLDDLFGTPSEDSFRWLAMFLNKNPNWQLIIKDRSVLLHNFRSTVRGEVEIPRLATMIESIKADVDSQPCDVEIEPRPATWLLKWDASKVVKEDDFEMSINIGCSDRPVSMEQTTAINSRADGMIRLPAHFAKTNGATIRYEPQPHKNTVGYWSDPKDSVSWRLRAAQPGTYVVSVLAGCGAGQGGSAVEFSVSGANPQPTREVLKWTTVDTGHFQNFRWQPIGEVMIKSAGEYTLSVKAVKMAKSAVVDIREINLVLQAK